MNENGRSSIVEALHAEIIGPDPHGELLDTSNAVVFDTFEHSRGPWRDAATGEEIITDRVSPMRRYASAVLFPRGAETTESNPNLLVHDITGESDVDGLRERNFSGLSEQSANDYEIGSANEMDPRSSALSFVLPLDAVTVHVQVTGAYYEPFSVQIGRSRSMRHEVESATTETTATQPSEVRSAKSRSHIWHVRRPVVFTAHFDISPSSLQKTSGLHPDMSSDVDKCPIGMRAHLYIRGHAHREETFVTVAVENITEHSSCDTHGLFQTKFTVWCVDSGGNMLHIPPYPEREDSLLLQNDPEARSIALMYRDYRTYAIGHGCSASWSPSEGAAKELLGHYLPTYETPSITPDIFDDSGESLAVSMKTLANLDDNFDSQQPLVGLVNAYERWINKREREIPSLGTQHLEAAQRHIVLCRNALSRMRVGIELIASDDDIRRAFELANESVYLQQVDTPPQTRKVAQTKGNPRIIEPRKSRVGENVGYWRPFQIGFLLSALASTANSDDPERESVDLIFFPTGGGKTEAYQALIAFSLFLNRLRETDQGVGAVMRYTLRLLTTQQFTRAASLICAMELVRQRRAVAGPRFSIGIWVGGSVTPLRRSDGISELRKLHGRGRTNEHHFLLTRCPHCSTSFEKIDGISGAAAWPAFTKTTSPFTLGKETIVFTCPDSGCPFSSETSPLPVWVIDEDIYDQRPSLVIATVDKFAQVAFNGDLGVLFGLNQNGTREAAPPSLIVQDELHLISGPLGTMVGLYEGLFEEFCLDRRFTDQPSRPKIVCSTATIRNFGSQIEGLFARQTSTLFPPHGLTVEDSFFATFSRDAKTGVLDQGRLYVGVLGTSLRSTQDLQVRTYSSLLQAPMHLEITSRDPWFTLLNFFNRIQDIGTTFTLLQINVRAYLKSLWERQGTDKLARRYINARSILELTSRIKDTELPSTIDRLSSRVDQNPVDTCLASNIIEVGIDIPRLSLITLLGQPKTTSQYIQVTGRVGRDWRNRPGLVVTMYPPRRARDRSHFEKFRSYHQRLYAAVEPTSVTPFSLPALERALHAVLVGYVRNFSRKDIRPNTVPEQTIVEAVELMRRRLMIVDPSQLEDFDTVVARRLRQWKSRGRTEWEARTPDDLPLIFRAGSYVPDAQRELAWETPQTMRNVDAECIARINDTYVLRNDSEALND